MSTTIFTAPGSGLIQTGMKVQVAEIVPNKSSQPGALKRTLIWWAIRLQIVYYACVILRRPDRIWRVYDKLITRRSTVMGGNLKKIVSVDGRYYFNLYTPCWPSKAYDTLVKNELRRFAAEDSDSENLSFVFLAITRKCPMRCEHCFEWDNLNQRETFTKQDLLKVIQLYQQEGVLQFHFSGGEPMTRIKDLIDVIRFASQKSECWVVTSGFNLTHANADLLKAAGCKGIVVSIDHYLPEVHNLFRGHPQAFDSATKAVRAALDANLVVAISVCATKSFIDGQHLLPYLDFAKELGVHFVQVLEPKDIGHYSGKNVLLEQHHIDELEIVFKNVNFSAHFQRYPTLLYHGYHQRRVGCFAGNRSVYVDSAGDVHACPFCHTGQYNILQYVRGEHQSLPKKANMCPRYDKIA